MGKIAIQLALTNDNASGSSIIVVDRISLAILTLKYTQDNTWFWSKQWTCPITEQEAFSREFYELDIIERNEVSLFAILTKR